MTGTERSSEPHQFADESGRRGRILMIAGALIGTLMLASAGILVGGASTGTRLDAVDWHRTGPGARDGSIPVATESRLRTAPTVLGPSAHPAHSSVARRPTPKQALSARPTPRRTNSTRPTPAPASRTPTPAQVTVTPAVQPTRSSVAPPPTAATPPGRTHVPPGQTRHPKKH
ncbi:hypothetical protein ACIBI9_05270 [Nonomuraea sp. NPDC050451]|uniref:hypothetical protein n=1 Tax=Nonomuraea sp. NPDC050451 TaxID=3364364 RepID=UPI003790C47E